MANADGPSDDGASPKSSRAMRRFEEAFDALPAEYREIITLARLVELSRADAAGRTIFTEAANRRLLSRALARLAVLVARAESGDDRER